MSPFGQRSWFWTIFVGWVTLFAQVAATTAADGKTVAVAAADCQALIKTHTPPNVAYQPGVDVRGKPVAPADLGASIPVDPPTWFSAPITVDLANRYGANAGLSAELKVPVAHVEYADGQVFLNGHPITSSDQQRLADACRASRGIRKR